MPKPGNEPSTWNEFPVFNEQMEFACIEGNTDVLHYTPDAGGKAKSGAK